MTGFVGKQFGNYRIIRELGKGGFAKVYLAQHVHLNTQVAIKVLSGQMSPQDEQNFLEEARNIARLKHPHIIKILDFGVEANTQFMVMDYAPNGTLSNRHPQGRRVPLHTIISYVRQIADALQYAHNTQLVHRDIKPENMLVGANNEVLLSDFGIAVVVKNTRTQTTKDVIGTFAYMAPEQFRGKPLPASDQYALACVIYEWVCGEWVFNGDVVELIAKHVSEPPAPLQTKVSSIPHAFDLVMLKALSKDPQQRFVSIHDFALALEQASQVNLPPTALAIPFASQIPAANTPFMPANVAQSYQTQADAPTAPMNLPKPTDQDVYQALISPSNPYAAWGTLTLDDNANKIWNVSGDGMYAGNIFFAYNGNKAPIVSNKGTFRNFAYQAQIALKGNEIIAGIVFRASNSNELYYAFYITTDGRQGNNCFLTSNPIGTLYEGRCTAIYAKKPNLLAVVVQENVIDVYVNLRHVTRVTDTSILNAGFVGILNNYCGQEILVSYAKVWVKKIP